MRTTIGQGGVQLTGADRHAVAARLRGILASHLADPAVAAKLLGVEELSLRLSVDETSPFPTVDVLIRVVTHFGVDPAYLLTGQYDGSTHRKTLDADTETVAETIRHFTMFQAPTPISRMTEELNRSRT